MLKPLCLGLGLALLPLTLQTLFAQDQFDIPVYKDFPKKGVDFKDIFPLLANVAQRNILMERIVSIYQNMGVKITAIVGLESRGFILGMDLATRLNVKFVPIRKANKLPGATFKESYKKEYGEDVFEISQSALNENDLVIIIDDLIATGGSAQAAINLVEKTKAQTLEFLTILNVSELASQVKLSKPLRVML